MELTEENKKYIDSLSIKQLLSKIRFAPLGDPWFQDETGDYWMKRYTEKRDENPSEAVRASKNLGWG
jgi:hypothetical protein